MIFASSAQHMDDARALFREYADSLPFSLEFQGFTAELASLPGRYAAPSGRLILAYDGTRPVASVALRDISKETQAGTCEMKRLYVRPEARGKGLGVRLCELLIAEARTAGYVQMNLDTSQDMHPAMAVYTRLGFTPCPRYNDDDDPNTRWFSMRL